MSQKQAPGSISCENSIFNGYFYIDGKQYQYSGSFDAAIKRLQSMEVVLNYDSTDQLNGQYTIAPGTFVGPASVYISLVKGTSALQITGKLKSVVSQSYVDGKLSWLA